MAKRRKPKPPKKRNIIARDANPQPGAGPMKDKRKLSRRQQKLSDQREAERNREP